MNNSGKAMRSAPSARAWARAARALAAFPATSPTVGELLDRGVEQFDDQYQNDGGDQLDSAHRGGADQPRQRQRQCQRGDLLANGLLRADSKDQAVARIDRGPPQPQQLKVPPQPASVWPCRLALA